MARPRFFCPAFLSVQWETCPQFLLKVDLAVIATTPEPDKTVIDAKIEETLKLEGQLLGAEYGYIAAQRRVLTPEQQISFDMEKIHGAMHGKKGRGVKGGKH